MNQPDSPISSWTRSCSSCNKILVLHEAKSNSAKVTPDPLKVGVISWHAQALPYFKKSEFGGCMKRTRITRIRPSVKKYDC